MFPDYLSSSERGAGMVRKLPHSPKPGAPGRSARAFETIPSSRGCAGRSTDVRRLVVQRALRDEIGHGLSGADNRRRTRWKPRGSPVLDGVNASSKGAPARARHSKGSIVDTRIIDRPAFRLVGYAARVPLVHQGRNPHIEAHIASLPVEERGRLKELGDTEPAGLLQVSADVDPDYAEGSQFTFLFGVALDTPSPVPDGLDLIEVPTGTWAVFRTTASFQSAWMTIVSEWFPSNPWRLRPGPSILTDRGDEHSDAPAEVWIPVERG